MNRTKRTMNRTKHFSNRLLISFFALVLSGVIVAQEGTRSTIDMMQQGSIVQGYYDYEIAEQTYMDGYPANIWGWVPYGVNDGPDPSNPDLRIKRITDRSITDPHIGINAIPDNHSSSCRLATQRYLTGYDDYGYPWTESAKGGRVGYVFTVTEQNAIAVLDYAVMLEYPQSHSIVVEGNGWKYYQPWVQMFISVVDENGNDYPQEPTRIIHAYTAPNGLAGWKQPTTADGWDQLNNIPLYDASTGDFSRNMVLLKKDWSSAGFDLRSVIGYTVCIWCEYYDCAISYKGGNYDDPEICWDHHMARLYSSLNCTQPLLQKESETCEPASAVTYSAPEGFAYRWYTAANPGVTISTDRVCTYQFGYRGEQTTLFCELQSPSSMSPTTLNVDIADKCVIECTYEFPTYVCADASTIDVTFNYTSGYPKSYDITFDDNALVNGFVSLTNQTILQGSTMISVPMPPSNNTQYARPNIYYYTLRVHQSNGTDTVFSKALEVRYPSKIISQRWNDVLALLNQNYNGGYMFSSIEWFQDGAPAWSNAPYKTYLYQPGGLKAESEYWAQLTRTLDGLTFCTCPFRPVIQPENTPAPERIQLTADNTNSRVVHVKTNMSGVYTLYNIDGKIIRQGYFGTEYGSPTIQLPAAGTYIIRFDDNEQGSETKKWLAN